MEAPENKNEVIELFKNGVNILEKALTGLNENELDYEPAKKGWTIREIIHHIADGDDIWKNAVKMALGNENAELSLKWYTELTQIDWADKWSYKKRSIDKSLALFRANRDHILQLLESSPNSWSKSIKFIEPDGKIEKVPIGFVIKMQSGHVEHHVKRILEIRKEFAQAKNKS